jgi:hypothetical protein
MASSSLTEHPANPGSVTASTLSLTPGLTDFDFQFDFSDAENRLDFTVAADGDVDETFELLIKLQTNPAPALIRPVSPLEGDGRGFLTLRWEKTGLNTATAPAAGFWDQGLGFGSSMTETDRNIVPGLSYEVVLAYDDDGGGIGAYSKSFTWFNFNGPGSGSTGVGGDFYIYLDPGLAGPPVPIPPALWLFGSGLVALVGMGRSRRRGEKGGPKTHTLAGGARCGITPRE